MKKFLAAFLAVLALGSCSTGDKTAISASTAPTAPDTPPTQPKRISAGYTAPDTDEISDRFKPVIPQVKESDKSKKVDTSKLPKPNRDKATCVKNVPYKSQKDYPTGCELVTASMLLCHYGFDTNAGELVEKYVNYSASGGDPNKVYIGNPRSSGGYGCYSGTIRDTLSRFLENETADVYYLTGKPLQEICDLYIDLGQPVMIWASIGMTPLYFDKKSSWKIEETGEEFTWLANEHCLLLVGFDENYYYLHDPLKEAYTPYARELVDMRYEEMGCQAVTVIPW